MLTTKDLLRGTPDAVEGDPLAHLSACHRRLEQRLDSLERAGNAFPDRRDEALAAIDAAVRFFATNGVRHTEDEEQSLFPRLLPKLAPEDRAVIDALEAEHIESHVLHQELEALAHRLRSDASLVPQYLDCARRLAALYARHIAVEDSTVAQLARRHLTPDELDQIATEMRQRREPAR